MVKFLDKIRSMLTASESLDTLVYLNADSFDAALTHWFDDLITELATAVSLFSRFDFESTGSVVDLTERVLERENKEFLDKQVEFVARVELILAQKSIQYAQICKKFAKPQDVDSDVRRLLNQEGTSFLAKLDHTLDLISKFALRRLTDAKKRKVNLLPSRKKMFDRMHVFSTLDRPTMLSLLKERGEV